MTTPLDGERIEVAIENGHRVLEVPLASPRHPLSVTVCKKCESDFKRLAEEPMWNVVHTTFLATKMEDFHHGREVMLIHCQDVFGTPCFLLRSPLKTRPRGKFGAKVVEFMLLPTSFGYVCAMAYERTLGQLPEPLAETIMERINCWIDHYPASTPPRNNLWMTLND